MREGGQSNSRATPAKGAALKGNRGATSKSPQNSQGTEIAKFSGGIGRPVQWNPIQSVTPTKVGPRLLWRLLPVQQTLPGGIFFL